MTDLADVELPDEWAVEHNLAAVRGRVETPAAKLPLWVGV